MLRRGYTDKLLGLRRLPAPFPQSSRIVRTIGFHLWSCNETLPTPTNGPLTLANRVFMAPPPPVAASSRAMPTTMMAEYYRQRASAG